MGSNTDRFVAARDQLLHLREDLARAGHEFRWPALEQFNWVRDYFDAIAWVAEPRSHSTRANIALARAC